MSSSRAADRAESPAPFRVRRSCLGVMVAVCHSGIGQARARPRCLVAGSGLLPLWDIFHNGRCSLLECGQLPLPRLRREVRLDLDGELAGVQVQQQPLECLIIRRRWRPTFGPFEKVRRQLAPGNEPGEQRPPECAVRVRQALARCERCDVSCQGGK